MAFTPVLQNELGIPPTVVMALVSSCGMFICLHYMSPMALVSDNLLQGRGWKESDLSKLGLVYAMAGIVAFLISVFYWQAIGIV